MFWSAIGTFAIVLLFAPFSIMAQSEVPVAPASEPVSTPKIYITNLILDKSSFQAGELVTGHFDILNKGNTPTSDVYYNVILVGRYMERVPQDTFDTQRQGPVSLGIGEKKTVKFSYTPPAGFSYDDLGIRIQAVLKSGIRMGWSDAHMSIVGGTSIIEAHSEVIVTESGEYPPGSGPTVSPQRQAIYKVTLVNPSDKPMIVFPKITIYRYGAADIVVYQNTGAEISLAPKKSQVVEIILPGMDGKAGVYFGNLSFQDAAGSLRAPLQTFRYIIDGSIVTIQGVSADKISAVSGDTVKLKVTYTGAPFNIATGQRSDIGMVTMNVVAFDADGNEVGRASKEADASLSAQTHDVDVPISVDAKSLRYDITVQKGDNILSKYSSNILTQARPVPNAGPADYTFAKYIGITSALLLVIILIIYLIARHNRGGKLPHYLDGIGMLMVIMIFVLGFSVSRLDITRAFIHVSSSPTTYYPLFINIPYDNQQFLPGQTFYLEGMATYWECDNNDLGLRTLTVTYNGNTTYHTVGDPYPSTASSSPYSTGMDVSEIFSVGPFTAPGTQGNYRMDITYTVPRAGNPDYFETGYVNTVVSASAGQETGPITLSNSIMDSPCGGFVGLRWTSLVGANQYKVYKDNGTSIVYDGPNLSYVDHVSPSSSHTYYVVPSIGGVPQEQSNVLSVQASGYCPLSIYYAGAKPNPAIINQTVNWAVWPVGGSGVYSYQWTGTDGLNDSSGRVALKSYATPGTKNAQITVTSTDGQVVTQNISVPILLSNGYDAIECFGTPTEAVAGHPVVWVVNTTPAANGSQTYIWSGSEGLYGTTQSLQKIYNTLGLKHAQVDIQGVGSYPDCLSTIDVKWKSIFREL